MANVLGERGPPKTGLASLFGFVSTSCPFAALAPSRSVLVKGATPVYDLPFFTCSIHFGDLISAGIQVLVTSEQMVNVLGERGPTKAGLASFFGFVSSSCSFAALAASRSVLVKGAHPVNALSFLIASTNLVLELGIVLWVLLGWKFTLGNILLGLIMVAYAYALTWLWFPHGLADQGKRHAEQAQRAEGMEMEHGMRGSWHDKLFSREGWRWIAHAFFMEWKMVWKEILFGFTVAGFISVFVPQVFWDTLFIGAGGGQGLAFLAVLENAAVAPIVAFFTFIGSMGNVPLAAMLWSTRSEEHTSELQSLMRISYAVFCLKNK